jgi:PAS domain-containing protein
MDAANIDIRELHWLMDMLHTIDVGLIVLDRDYRVRIWNGFMENHSGRSANDVIGGNLFESFPAIAEPWLRRKVDSVLLLASRSFTTWEQRPYLLRFKNYRPITGTAEFMYQNDRYRRRQVRAERRQQPAGAAVTHRPAHQAE